MRAQTCMAASALALAALGCRDGIESPTAPAASEPQPGTAAASAGSWVALADYPRDIWDAASASLTDPSSQRTMVYVIGGRYRVGGGGSGNMTDAVRAYDVSAKAWQRRAPFPVRVRTTNGAVAIDGRIYVSGGFTRRWDEQREVWRLETLQSLYVYNPATDSWRRRRDMPLPTAGGASAAYNGKLYVATFCHAGPICGSDIFEGALWRYDPSTDRWTLVTRTPHDIWRGGIGFIGGKFYIGGWQGALDIYDLATDSWSVGPGILTGIGCGGVGATLQARLYFVGCLEWATDEWLTLVFDPEAGEWSRAAPPPVPVGTWHALTRVLVNGQPRLELIGGPVPGNHWRFRP